MSPRATKQRKVVLLTGASGAIGTAFCERYASTYDVVAVAHRRPLEVASQHLEVIDPFAAALAPSAAKASKASTSAAAPSRAKAATEPVDAVFEVTADLTCASDVARVVEVALARHGRIDAVVNALGAFGRKSGLLGAELDQAAAMFEHNALAPTAVAVRVALDYWRHHDEENRARNRVVVNLSAAAAVDAADRTFPATFGASKAALNMLSLHLAEELAPFKVRVMTVAPAPVPEVVSLERVTSAIAGAIEGDESGRVLLLWDDGDELV